MRILSLGYALPNQAIDNYNVLTAPSYSDYDAMIVDAEAITRVPREAIEDDKEFKAFDGRPVVNGSSTAAAVSIADQMKRRNEEAVRLLEAGGTIAILARPNASIPGIIGFEGADRYTWLPAPEGASWSPPLLRAGEGTNIRIRDDVHPIADVIREFRKAAGYRAVFDDRHASFRGAAHTIAVGGSNVPVSVQFDVLAGRVIFLPAFNFGAQANRSKFAQAMADAVRQVQGTPAESAAPPWSRSLALPGLEQLEAELDEAEAEQKDAERRVTDVRERVRELSTYRALLWAEGHQFEQAVRASLQALGFTITSNAGQPTVATADDDTIFVEFESSREPVVEWPYIRLQRRLEEHLLRRKEQPHGLVIANGERGDPPEQRKRQYTDPLRIACENYRYGLMTADTLFALAQRALGGAEEDELAAMRRRIARARGEVTEELALGDTSPGDTGGAIF